MNEYYKTCAFPKPSTKKHKRLTVSNDTYQKVYKACGGKCVLMDGTCNGTLELHHISGRRKESDRQPRKLRDAMQPPPQDSSTWQPEEIQTDTFRDMQKIIRKRGLIMEDINSMKFYRSFFEAIDDLEDENRLALYDAIMRYQFAGENPSFKNKYLKAIWITLVPNIDSANKSILDGQKGGRPKTKNSPPIENEKTPLNLKKQPPFRKS